MKIHIKRMDLFAVLTLTNDKGKTFTTTMRRDVSAIDDDVLEMVRRFSQEKKVIDKKPVLEKTRGRGAKTVQGELL